MSEIGYLNTDLIIESPDDLTAIFDTFGDEVIVMYNGELGKVNRAAYGIAGSYSNANDILDFFCVLVEGFDETARSLWDSCSSKVFDFGNESGTSPQNYSSVIRPEVIKRISDIGAGIEITIYTPIDKRKKQ